MERYQGSDQKTIDSELTALLTEELIGNEQFIDKVVAEQPNIAMRIVKKIQNLIKLFKMSGEKRAEYKVLTLAENMYLRSAYDHGRQNLIQIIEQGREDNKQVQVDEQNAEVGVDQTLALQYNNNVQFQRKFSFLHKNFPGERESGGSEAHRLAIWWTRQPNIVAGDQTLISMNGRWYLVEKFDDADNGYQVEDYVTKAEYNKIFEEIKQNGRSGKILSIQRAFANYDKFDKLNYSIKGRKPSVDSLQTQYSGEDSQLLRMDKTKSSRREFESNRSGDSESSGASKQGIDYSLKDSQGKELSQQQAEYFRDSKVRDEQGNLLVVYHGTNLEFNTFDLSKAGSNFGETSQGFFFFTNKKDSYPDSAIDYARKASKFAGKPIVKEVYLNIKNPLKLNSKGYYNTVAYYDKNSDNIYEQYFKGDYDGVIIENSDKTSDDSILCLVDSANQIKRIDNLNPTSNQDIRYSIKPFAEQVDDILGGKDTTSTHLKIMDTPQILQDVGLPKLPILMTARHLDTTVNESGKKGLNYHGLGIDIIKQLPKLIEKPALIAESLTRDDSVVLITQAVDKKNKPIIVAIKVNGIGRLENIIIQANVMTSAYGKDNFYSYIKKFIDNDKILFWDKKRSQRVSVNPGLQLSDVIINLASNTIIRKIDIKSQDFVSKNPNDIKLSRKSPAPSNEGDIIKAKGNLTTDKIFTKAEAKKIIADIEERLIFEEKGMVGTVKGTNELIDRLWKGLNKANKGEYIGVGVEIADYVINHTVVEDIYEALSGDVEVDEAREVIKTLKQYFHKVKISDRVLGEIKHHFDDKAGKVLSLWRAKEGGLADKINNDTKSQTVLAFILQ